MDENKSSITHKKYEYYILNMSELTRDSVTIDIKLKELGDNGFKFAFKIKELSWAFYREL